MGFPADGGLGFPDIESGAGENDAQHRQQLQVEHQARVLDEREQRAVLGRDVPALLTSELIVATASGHKTKSEEFGYGDNEFVPWHLGATL